MFTKKNNHCSGFSLGKNYLLKPLPIWEETGKSSALSYCIGYAAVAVVKYYEHKQLMDELIWAHSSRRRVRDGEEDMTAGSWMWKLIDPIFKPTQEAEKRKWKWDEVVYIQRPPPGMDSLRRESQRRKSGLSGRTTPACLFDTTASFSFINN